MLYVQLAHPVLLGWLTSRIISIKSTSSSDQFQNNYQQDGTFGLSFISGLAVLHSTCFELQGAHHQEFHFFTVQAASGILCNLLLYCTLSLTCSVPDVGERVQYSKRLHSMPEAACTVKKWNSWWWAPWSSKHLEWRTTNPEIKDSPKVSSCW